MGASELHPHFVIMDVNLYGLHITQICNYICDHICNYLMKNHMMPSVLANLA